VTKVNGPTLSSSPYVSDAPFVLLTLGVPAALRSLPSPDEPCVATELEAVDPTDASEIFRRIPLARLAVVSQEGVGESLVGVPALDRVLISLGVELLGVLVDLQVLLVDSQAQAGEVVARLLPVERILDELAHLVDAVEPDGHDHRGHVPDPVERGGEHERRGEHEEEEDELQHVQIRERDRRRHDSLHGLVRG
jgi:hypothetical protein